MVRRGDCQGWCPRHHLRESRCPASRHRWRRLDCSRRPIMSSIAISAIVFGVILGGALLGMALRALLPEHHLSQDSRDVVKLGMGLIGTMAALVLGLLIASAKSSFDAQRNGLAQLSANLILLD